MTMVHVQLRSAEFGTGGPLLSFAWQTTAGESGAPGAFGGLQIPPEHIKIRISALNDKPVSRLVVISPQISHRNS